jgi:FkbM family methyltransferase
MTTRKQLLWQNATAAGFARPAPPPSPEPPQFAPCTHEGPVLEWCTTCNSEARHVRECDLHEKCTREFVSGKVRACRNCADYRAEQLAPSASVANLIAQLDANTRPGGGWPNGWESRPEVIEAHRARLYRTAAKLPEYPGGHAGRGIVTCAGGAKYFTCAWVLIWLLRRYGCTLPIEVWYLGLEEMDPTMHRLLGSLGNVRLVDAVALSRQLPPDQQPRRLGGWESKAFAIQHSTFREVLFLDADQVPTRDPSYLFDAAEYRDSGCVFWPDYPPNGWCITRTGFEAAGLPVPGNTKNAKWKNPTDYRPVESGQILIDKARHWKPLLLCRHINDHSDFWYRHAAEKKGVNHIYGDKDTFYLAWQVLSVPYAMPRDAGWTGGKSTSGAFLQHDFAGKVLFQHRVQPVTKWSLHGDNHRTPNLVGWNHCEAALADLRSRWTGSPWQWHDTHPDDRGLVETTAGPWVLFQGDTRTPVQLLADGRVQGYDQAERWAVVRWGDVPHLALSRWDRAALVLGRGEGRSWCQHDSRNFLYPALPDGFRVHPGAAEWSMITSVIHLNEYRLPDPFPPGAVCLDIGGNVGAFVQAALTRGAAHVVTVEPMPTNLDLLRHNFGRDRRVTILPVAAWDKSETLHLADRDGARHSGGWSVVGTRAGIPCQGVPIDELILLAARLSPTGRIHMLKLDCEGAEWEILQAATRLDLVDTIAGEYHLSGRGPEYVIAWFATRLAEYGMKTEITAHPSAEGLGLFFGNRDEPQDTWRLNLSAFPELTT